MPCWCMETWCEGIGIDMDPAGPLTCIPTFWAERMKLC